MRVLLDECVPAPLAKLLTAHEVVTTPAMGWASRKNGELVRLAEQNFDVFVTSDQNLRYQQNLSHRTIAILLLPTNRWPEITKHIEAIAQALDRIQESEFVELTF
jgi:hypothetical protein